MSAVPSKSILRQPAKLTLLIALIALVSFAFVSRAAEGLAVGGEIDRLAGHYRSVGTLAPLGDDKWYVQDAAQELISRDESLNFTDNLRLIPALMDGIYSPDIDGTSTYINKIFLYGTLEKKSQASSAGGGSIYIFDFLVNDVVASLPEYAQNGETIRLHLYDDDNTLRHVFDGANEGERYFLKAQYRCYYERLDVGIMMKSYDGQTILRPLTDAREYLLSSPPEDVKEEIESLEENLRTVFFRATKDMTARPETLESFYLVEGRYIDENDDKNGSKVCVIRSEFAELRGLAVGDMLTVTMRNRQGYITDSETAKKGAESAPETFEIVGIYNTTDRTARSRTVSQNDVYVPDSSVPGWTRTPDAASFSFVLKSPEDENDFYKRNYSELEEMGWRLTFAENGWEGFQASTAPVKTSILISMVTFAIVLLIVFYAAVFLYFTRRRRDFAILRALGTPKHAALRETSLPIMIICGIGSAAGSVAAWFFASYKTEQTLAKIEGARFSGISAAWLALLMLALLMAAAVFTLIEASRLGRRPVLELLQGRSAKRKR